MKPLKNGMEEANFRNGEFFCRSEMRNTALLGGGLLQRTEVQVGRKQDSVCDLNTICVDTEIRQASRCE